jgi:heat shock protein HslJ
LPNQSPNYLLVQVHNDGEENMKQKTILLTFILVLVLAACGGEDPTPTPVPVTETPAAAEVAPTAVPPTEVPPTVPPTAAPATDTPAAESSPLDTMTHVPDPNLVNITWQWQQRDNPDGSNLITVPNPENYTLLFNEDGTFNAQIDCNNAGGGYASSGDGGIFMELGPMTRAACGPESLDNDMINMFGPAQNYRFEEDGNVLVFSWVAGGPVDTFRNAAAEEGEIGVRTIPPDAIQMNMNGLAETYSWQIVEASEIPPGPGGQGFPVHIFLTFDNETPEQVLANNGRRMYIFPVEEYIALYDAAGNTIVADQVTRLEQLIAEAPGRAELPGDPMPLLPPPSSFMDRWAQFSDLDFGVGTGVRYVSDSPNRQQIGPWTNDVTAYYYEGLTSNGRFYVSLYWPVSTAALPNTAAEVPADVNAQATNPETYPGYLQATKDTLNALTPAEWAPDLSQLDVLVQSLTFPTEAAPSLTGTTWEWFSLTNPLGVTAVNDPSRYTVRFNEDGTAVIKADCNDVAGTYTATDEGALAITLGPSTLALCPEDSQDQQFLTGLENAAVYFFQEGDLFIDMFADGGTLRFRPQQLVELPPPAAGEPTATVTAPDGIFLRAGPGTDYPSLGVAAFGETGKVIGRSQDGQWWVVETPNLPEGQAWVSAAFVEVENVDNVPVVAAPPLTPAFVGSTWYWVSLTTPVEQVPAGKPGQTFILFNADGTANFNTDCNVGIAAYQTEGSSISITVQQISLAACPEDSQEQLFLNALENAAIYFLQDGDLFIDLVADGGTMRFSPQPASGGDTGDTGDTGDNQPVAGAQGVTFQVVSFGPLGAEAPPLPGTTITALFTAAQVSGSAGCNSYTAPLTPVENYFTVGLPAVTASLCTDPAGIMEQETAFLAALQGVNGFEWVSQTFEDGRVVVTSGQLFYTLTDGTEGVMNLVAQ